MISRRIAIFTIFLILFSSQIFSQIDNPNTGDLEELEFVLKKCSEYCEKLYDSALFFVCEEKIVETQWANWADLRKGYALTKEGTIITEGPPYKITMGANPMAREVNRYVYDYQLLRKGKRFQERRTLLSENNEKRNEENAQLENMRFKHQQIVLAPLALLSKSNQPYYDYKIIGREERFIPKEIIIEVTPLAKMKRQGVYGKVWITEGDYSITKMEWEQESIGNLDWIKSQSELFEAIPEIKCHVEFNMYKNGIRFPSEYNITETYYRDDKKLFTRSKTNVSYRDYKFFTVETEQAIKKEDILSFYTFLIDSCNFKTLVLRLPH